jgi:hypothetical protein
MLTQRGEFSARALREARPDQLTATVPHAVHTLPLSAAVEGQLDQATHTGWRYLLAVDDEVIVSAETDLRVKDAHTFTQVTDGPFVAGTVDALTFAETVMEERPQTLELRVLHVPALYLMALWLTPPRADEDTATLYVPIAPAPTGVEANRVYEAGEFRTLVRQLGAAVPILAADDARGG